MRCPESLRGQSSFSPTLRSTLLTPLGRKHGITGGAWRSTGHPHLLHLRVPTGPRRSRRCSSGVRRGRRSPLPRARRPRPMGSGRTLGSCSQPSCCRGRNLRPKGTARNRHRQPPPGCDESNPDGHCQRRTPSQSITCRRLHHRRGRRCVLAVSQRISRQSATVQTANPGRPVQAVSA
jgi:hypothetical protein